MNENHSAALVRAWDKVRAASTVPAPEGTNPTPCAPLRLHAVDNSQRLNCERRPACLTFAMRRSWTAFSCTACPVRETVKPAIESRRGEQCSVPFPDVRR